MLNTLIKNFVEMAYIIIVFNERCSVKQCPKVFEMLSAIGSVLEIESEIGIALRIAIV